VAIYSLAYKIASVLKLVIVDSVKMALAPLIIKKIDTPGDKRFYSKTLLYSSFVLMTGIIGISLFSYEIIRLISGSDAFWEAYMLVPLLSVSVFFVNMRETTNYGLIIMKKTGIISAVVVVSGILNIGLNILLIPRFDVMGAASATIVTNLIYWFACYYFSQRIWYVPYEIRKVAILFITGVALSFSGLLLSDISIIPRLILKFVILGSFPFILYLFSFYEPAEIQAIRGFVSKWSDLKRLRANLRSLRPNDDED
jgi:O-antigen/teichoic acid export membrane protein